jgi:hypothetical protein
MAYFEPRGLRAGAERERNSLRDLIDYRPVAVHHLAWEERNRAWIAHVEQSRLLQEAGVATPGAIEFFRATVGTALIRFGEWLQTRSAKHRVSDAVSAF